MKCYRPKIISYKKKNTGQTGEMWVRCGKCLACREEIAKEYTYRFINESTFFNKIYFLTLTYDEEHIELNDLGLPTLNKETIVKYLKQVNINIRRKLPNEDYKYFLAGEYGDQTFRPHYHISILCNNSEIAKIFLAKWFNGKVDFQIGDIRSVFYVIGYSNKKIGDKDYVYTNEHREKPFRKFSKGLGSRYYEKNKNSMAKQYFGKIGRAKIGLPKYYKDKINKDGLVDISELKQKIIENNKELINFYKNEMRYEGDFWQSYDMLNDSIQESRDLQLQKYNTYNQRAINYEAKYRYKKSRDKI